ncbi:MAG TPA: PAS domain-containing sensor histidine kinase [Candidatus Limnocylindria bacterium]|nr:PAS domain-containing sensor histidine kinase [Candidatus Limnocylindria bacterium]
MPNELSPESSALDEVPLLRGEVAFRLLVDAVEDYAIFLLGPDGRVLTWNLGAQRIKGYQAREIIGQHFSVFYTPEEREAGRPMRLLAWAAEHGRFEDEGWRVRKDGSRFWADVIVTALRDEAGEPYAYAKITRDLTERRQAEEQRMALRAEQQSRLAAEEALAARDRFLSIASHELKTPIATLQLATESIARAHKAGRLDQERLTTSLRRVSRATHRLRELVAELLDVSRLTGEGETMLETQPIDLVGQAREVAERFEEPDGSCRVRVAGPQAAWVVADGGRLDQVITNLIDNALKYSNAPDRVEVDIVPEDDEVRLSVGDYGIGLDTPASTHLFEAFGRGKNAENIPGLGLGLYISEQIVARHGGRISAIPRPSGPGAIFSIWLPAAREEGAHGPA